MLHDTIGFVELTKLPDNVVEGTIVYLSVSYDSYVRGHYQYENGVWNPIGGGDQSVGGSTTLIPTFRPAVGTVLTNQFDTLDRLPADGSSHPSSEYPILASILNPSGVQTKEVSEEVISQQALAQKGDIVVQDNGTYILTQDFGEKTFSIHVVTESGLETQGTYGFMFRYPGGGLSLPAEVHSNADWVAFTPGQWNSDPWLLKVVNRNTAEEFLLSNSPSSTWSAEGLTIDNSDISRERLSNFFVSGNTLYVHTYDSNASLQETQLWAFDLLTGTVAALPGTPGVEFGAASYDAFRLAFKEGDNLFLGVNGQFAAYNLLSNSFRKVATDAGFPISIDSADSSKVLCKNDAGTGCVSVNKDTGETLAYFTGVSVSPNTFLLEGNCVDSSGNLYSQSAPSAVFHAYGTPTTENGDSTEVVGAFEVNGVLSLQYSTDQFSPALIILERQFELGDFATPTIAEYITGVPVLIQAR